MTKLFYMRWRTRPPQASLLFSSLDWESDVYDGLFGVAWIFVFESGGGNQGGIIS